MHSTLFLLPFLFFSRAAAGIYYPVREYSGATFFDAWTFYDNIDDTTWGNVTFVGEAIANSTHLVSVNSAGNAVIRVDDTDTVASATLIHRNSVRITTQATYGVGSIIVADFVHLPYGCSVWPSFWLLGTGPWPASGEVDIIEGINLSSANQFSLHTTPGCTQPTNITQTGKTLVSNCLQNVNLSAYGCTTEETKPNSFGAGFASAGGGVYALQMDVSGIYMWFWSRADIPKSVGSSTASSTLDISDWGTPSAAYPATTCNITEFFQPQQMILDITLCGSWAGVPANYAQTCPGTCLDNIIGNGSNYANAYFEIPYIRTYSLTQENSAEPVPVANSTTGSTASNSNSGSGNSSQSESGPAPTQSGKSAGNALSGSWRWALLVRFFTVALGHLVNSI
ncbi:GH16 domain-containing protein [Mycena chlorophos]|uniref:GH16 domain-containing protein n=1 Tax=Mycena chlorophos TaxID=658473 RepID=A0A8H6SUT6_MYCCL|nr:GH16 domain-containing protein [Mycena chlorophos]